MAKLINNSGTNIFVFIKPNSHKVIKSSNHPGFPFKILKRTKAFLFWKEVGVCQWYQEAIPALNAMYSMCIWRHKYRLRYDKKLNRYYRQELIKFLWFFGYWSDHIVLGTQNNFFNHQVAKDNVMMFNKNEYNQQLRNISRKLNKIKLS